MGFDEETFAERQAEAPRARMTALIERIAAEAGILDIPPLPGEPAPAAPKPKIAGRVATYLYVTLHSRSPSISESEALSLVTAVMRLAAGRHPAE